MKIRIIHELKNASVRPFPQIIYGRFGSAYVTFEIYNLYAQRTHFFYRDQFNCNNYGYTGTENVSVSLTNP